MKKAVAPLRSEAGSRARPSAAAVPAATASRLDKKATCRLVSSARSHDGSAKNAVHQRVDHASGGTRTKLFWLKATGTMARIGRIRSAATKAAKTLSQIPPRISA